MKRKIPSDTMYFEYEQQNPKNKSTGDCVIRAISSATETTWDEVYDALYSIGKKYKLMPDDKKCYQRYLKENGWVENKQPRKFDNTKYTGKEFCERLDNLYKSGIVRSKHIIAHIGGHHITSIERGSISGFTIHDTWDCSDYCIGNYWVKE